MPVWINTKTDNNFLARFRAHFILNWLCKFPHPIFRFKMVWCVLRIGLESDL